MTANIGASDPEKVLGLCEQATREALPTGVKIDSIGVGFGIMGGLRRTFPDLDIAGVSVAGAASDPGRFVNLRAEICWDGRPGPVPRRWLGPDRGRGGVDPR